MSSNQESNSDVIRQLHHRVKNNLQVICSLLRLQSNYLSDEATRGMFKSSEERVRSMALVHEKLCGTNDPSTVQFDEYITELVEQLLKSYPNKASSVKVDLQLEGIRLPVEQAVPCGLLVNELVANSLKHAQGDEGEGFLGVSMHRLKGNIKLEVRDQGPGLPEGFDLSRPQGLGLRVVQALARQLGATLAVERDGGTTFRVEFKAHADALREARGEPDAATKHSCV